MGVKKSSKPSPSWPRALQGCFLTVEMPQVSPARQLGTAPGLVEVGAAPRTEIISSLLFSLQLPEPLMPFRLYNELMGLAKESLQGGEAKGRSGKGGPELVDRGADTDQVVLSLVLKLRELLKELPCENMATLQYLLQHLRR